MAPKRKTNEQKTCRLARKVTELQQAGDFAKSVALTKKELTLVASVKRHLMALGSWPAAEQAHEPDEPLALEDDRCPANPPRHQQVDFPTFGFDINIEIHRDFGQWSKVPPKHLVTILHLTDPLAFNQKVLKNTCTKGQEVPPKDKLLELLGFATNIDPGSELGDFRSIGELTTTVRAKSQILGKKAEELVVPANWQELGIYKLLVGGGQPVLLKTGSPAPLDLPGVDLASLYTNMDFSEPRATLNSTSEFYFMKLCVFLHTNGLSQSAHEPAFKKARHLTDSSSDMAPTTPARSTSSGSQAAMSMASLSSALCDELTKELAPHSQQDSGPLAPPGPIVVPDDTLVAFQDTLVDGGLWSQAW